MKRKLLLFFMLLVLLSTGCGPETVAEEPEMPDLLVWTQEYVDAGDTAFAGGTVEEYEAAISKFVGKDLLVKAMKAANESVADVEINGKVYTREDKPRLIFGKETRRVEIVTELSPVYNDMNPERDFFKYVFVRSTYKLFDEEDDLIPERSHTRLYKHLFQKNEGEWKLYSVTELDGFPYDGESHTRNFNEEPITFTHYKDNEIKLMPIK